MDTAIVVFTRDLRLHDNPALHQACSRARDVVPLFVLDPALKPPPNRARFLTESLASPTSTPPGTSPPPRAASSAIPPQ